MSDLRLFNTLSREKETFVPLVPGEVRMYSCGPTVYNEVHIGNLRTFLWSDLLRRYLEWKGFRVNQVMNFTDVDDRIIKFAVEQGLDLETYTKPYIEAFYKDIDTLRIRRATLHPKATEHIPEMIGIVERLTAAGHTYVSEGSTYFRISTLPGYGRLSRVDVNTASDHSRLERDDDDKQDARDFVLWKAKKEGEPAWQTTIGEGRPGWHLECSAMSMKYLGDTFDIHTGGIDLVFPHHENEIAQSEGATGKPFVRYWVHGEHLIVGDEKMSKRLGNVFRLKGLLELGYSPLHIRYALLSVPHRTKLSFSMAMLDDARSAVERIGIFLARLEQLAQSAPPDARQSDGHGEELIGRFLTDFESAMDDDLNTAGALGALFVFIRDSNIALDAGRITPADASGMLTAIRRIDPVVDIFPVAEADLDAEIEAQIAARVAARKSKNFAESDRIRDELLARGIILEDTPQGMRWRRK